MIMRNIILTALLLLSLASCGGGGSKFEGKWKPAANSYGIGNMKIEKEGKVYKISAYREGSEEEGNSMSFLYDKDRDVLTMETGREIMDIEYNSKKKTIKMGPRGGGVGWGNQSIEFERIK